MSARTEGTFEARPSPLSVWLTAILVLVAVAASAGILPATVLGLLALVLTSAGVYRGAHRVHKLGAIVLFGSVLVAGVEGATPPTMLVATAAAVVAWDAGDNAISIGTQVGSQARTRRIVLAHTGATVGVAAAVGVVGFTVYRATQSGLPTTALVLLLFATVLFTILLGR